MASFVWQQQARDAHPFIQIANRIAMKSEVAEAQTETVSPAPEDQTPEATELGQWLALVSST